MAKVKAKNKEDDDKKIKCPSCGKEKLKSREFYQSDNIKYDGYDHRCYICKACLKNKCFSEKGLFDKDLFKKVLKEDLDKPFYEKLYQTALQDDKDTLGKYLSLLNINNKGKKLCWANGETEENKLQTKNNSIIEMGIQSNFEVTPEMTKFWGKFKQEEYEFLQEYYEELISVYDHSTPIQINIYKNMAKAQLQGNQCLANGDINGYEKAMRILSSLSTDANIKPVQETGEKEGLSTWGEWVKKIEETEPIPEATGEFKDADKIMKYIDKWFVKHFARMLGLNNDPLEDDASDEILDIGSDEDGGV